MSDQLRPIPGFAFPPQCDTCGSWPDKVASVSINGGDGEFTICQGCLAAIDFDLNAPQGVRDRRKIQ